MTSRTPDPAHQDKPSTRAIEQSDNLKSSYHGAAATRLHVLRDSFDAALLHPSIAARQIGERALGPACLACDIHAICGAASTPTATARPPAFWAPRCTAGISTGSLPTSTTDSGATSPG